MLMFCDRSKKIQPLLLCLAISLLIAWPVSFLPRWAAATCVLFVTVSNVAVLLAERSLVQRGRALADEAARERKELVKVQAAMSESLKRVSTEQRDGALIF